MMLYNNPVIGVVQSKISDNAIERIIGVDAFEKSKGWDFSTNSSVDTGWRTSSTYFDFFESFRPEVMSILDSVRQEFGHHYSLEQTEQLQVAKYEPGQYYKPHRDYFNVPNVTPILVDRVATVILYLNDDFEGGHTNFTDLSISVKPKKGNLLYFQYLQDKGAINTLHEGAEVTSGVKYIATLWIRESHPWR